MRSGPCSPYCLANLTDWPQNIIVPEVVEHIKEERDNADKRSVVHFRAVVRQAKVFESDETDRAPAKCAR
jgi:hypothetical protein